MRMFWRFKKLLNKIPPNQGGPDPKLKEDGWIGPKTNGAIFRFQRANQGLAHDGRIDVTGPTLVRINARLAGLQPVPPRGPGRASFFGRESLRSLGAVRERYRAECDWRLLLRRYAGIARARQPTIIKKAIYYDSTTQRFRVTLYDKLGNVRYIWVDTGGTRG
jgi:hypothetical protein